MPGYYVNATVSFLGALYVTADSPEEALEEAREARAADWDYDTGSGDVEFNVTPEVELAR